MNDFLNPPSEPFRRGLTRIQTFLEKNRERKGFLQDANDPRLMAFAQGGKVYYECNACDFKTTLNQFQVDKGLGDGLAEAHLAFHWANAMVEHCRMTELLLTTFYKAHAETAVLPEKSEY